MKLRELRQIIREEITKIRLNETLDSSKIEQSAKKVIKDYVVKNNLGTIKDIIYLGYFGGRDEIKAYFKILFSTGKETEIDIYYDYDYNVIDIKTNNSKRTGNKDEQFIEIEHPSGNYSGDIKNGKVSFLLIDDSIEGEYEDGFYALEGDENIMDYLGRNHFFTKLYKTIGGKFDIESDAVGITVDLNDLKSKFGKYIV